MERNVVDVETFIRNLERELEDVPPGRLDPTTRFRDLAAWTSLEALMVVASFERDYGVSLSDEELEGADTLQDLYDVVLQQIGP
jgi:acyl carrier protein